MASLYFTLSSSFEGAVPRTRDRITRSMNEMASFTIPASFPVRRRPCKSLSRENTVLLTRASEERALRTCQIPQLARVPLGGGSCLRRTGHPFAVSGPEGPSQKIECVFSASPETIRREPREFDLRRSVGNRQDLAVCALCNSVFRRRRVSMPLHSCELLQARSRVVPDPRRADTRPSSELRQASLDCHSLLLRGFINQGQIVILPGRQLGGFHQHPLDMFVALFGKRGARHLVG